MKRKKNRLLEIISRRKIRQQLYIIYLMAVFVPIAIVGSVLLINTSRILTNYYANLLESDNLRVKTTLFELTSQTYNISETISFEQTLQEILSAEKRVGEERVPYSTIDNYIYNHAEIEDITVYTDNPYAAGYVHFAEVDAEIRGERWFQKALSQTGVFWIALERQDKYGNSYWNLALVRKITVIGSDSQAVLVIRLSDNYLQTRVGSKEYRIILSADNGINFYSSNRMGYGETQATYVDYSDDNYQYTGPVWIDADKIFTNVSTLQLYQSESRIYVTTMNEDAYNDIAVILVACAMIIIMALAIPGLLIHYFTNFFTGRVSVLRNEMKKATNEEYDNQLVFGGEDELTETFSDLQVMIRKIKEMDAKMYEARIGEQQLLNQQQEMEMKMLASQINPHFLYNTLESIRMQALSAGNRDVANSIKLLGKSMRHVLENTGTTMVTLKKELDYMETYLQIQKIRFGNRINYKITCQDDMDLEQYMLLPLLLQPIVENALIHGLEQRDEDGLVTVAVTAPEEEILRIIVSDNGCGMSEEELERLQKMMAQKTIDRSNSIGLCNIHRRIRLCYGGEYGLIIESKPGEGTKVVVTLPIKCPSRG